MTEQNISEREKVSGDLTAIEIDILKPLLEKLFRTTQNPNVKSHVKGILLKLVGLY